MSPRRVATVTSVALALGACGDADAPPAPTPPPAPVLAAPPPVAVDAGITTLPTFDPTAGHLDDDDGGDVRPPASSRRPATRARRTLEVILRSTPLGATAAVDGVVIGKTPAYWEGEFTGGEREFTFVLAGHAMARYRFVPTQSGIVHARLDKLAIAPRDAGVPEIPQPAPATAPVSVAPPAPRPTPRPPPDAAPPPSPPTDASAPVTPVAPVMAPTISPVGPTP